MTPRKHPSKTEWGPLEQTWADLVKTDPMLAQTLGQVPFRRRLASIPGRMFDWMGVGFSVDGPMYPWM